MARSSASSRATSSSVPTPWAHQAQTIRFFETRPRGFDFSAPGTGKTRAQLELYARRKPRGRCLIVCPKTLMRSAWAADIEKFTPQLTYAIADADNRQAAFELGTDIVILNTDGVRWFLDKRNQLDAAKTRLLKGFDHLIVDESTSYKEPSSQRSKAMVKLAQHLGFTYRYLMTGTPNPNSVTELWNQAYIVDDGARLGKSFHQFRNATQIPTQRGPSAQHVEWHDKPGIVPVVDELIRDITIRHAFEDVMTHVPPNHRETKTFELNRKTKTLYNKLENECILELQSKVVSAVHAASLRAKLLQVASGAVYTSGENGEYEVIDRQRYALITELVEERDHSVVFFNWRHQRDELAREFNKAGFTFAVIDGSVNERERSRIVADYQAGKYRTLLLHPRTGAHGITLTRGTTTILASPIYEADLLQQAVHRVYRGSQTERTNTIFVEAKDTVEALVFGRLSDKENRMMDLLDLLKERRAA
jgi:SNF2 family DNA or RNA helicase